MNYLYIVIIKDTGNKTYFNECALLTTTNYESCLRIVNTLNECLSKRYEAFFQIEYIWKVNLLTRLKVHITEFLNKESEVLWVFLGIRVTQVI